MCFFPVTFRTAIRGECNCAPVAVGAVPTVNSTFSDAGGDLQTELAKLLLAQHKSHPNWLVGELSRRITDSNCNHTVYASRIS